MMAGLSFAVSVDLPGINGPLTESAFPNLATAVDVITEAAFDLWCGYASGRVMLPDGGVINNRTGEYLRSISRRELTPFSSEVYSDLPYATFIEDGSPARDLTRILSSSLKVRVSHDGRRYLIIPFRHSAPGSVMGNSMSEAVHDWWKEKGRRSSRVLAVTQRFSGTGAWDVKTRQVIHVAAWQYRWGSRLGKGDLEALGVGEARARRLEGMVRFRKLGGKGGAAHSQYLTFRVMIEGSPKWKVPAQPGRHPARATADRIRPEAEEAFRAAVEADIAAAIGGAIE